MLVLFDQVIFCLVKWASSFVELSEILYLNYKLRRSNRGRLGIWILRCHVVSHWNDPTQYQL